MRRPPFVMVCALDVLLGCAGLFPEHQVVTVRVIDARNGRPYKRLQLRIQLLKAIQTSQGFRTDAEARANLIATKLETTNDKGEVTFDLPTPLPGVIEVDSGPMACGTESFDTQAVTKEGVVGESHCKTKWTKMKVNFRAKPGEIVYFATHVGFFEGALTK